MEEYWYRNNFEGKKSTVKKRKSTRIKLFNLIIDGYRRNVIYDVDYFVGIAQFLQKKGLPMSLSINENTKNLEAFFMNALFSICPFHLDSIWRNKKVNLVEWRKQFDLFNEIKLTGLNFYPKRSAMPLPNFSSVNNIYKIVFKQDYFKQDYNQPELLKFSFNSSWEKAIYVIEKKVEVLSDRFYYKISYGNEDDYQDAINNKSCSSWDIVIESEIGENYIDFLLRIKENYDAIVSGSKDVLISQKGWEGEDFYLGGRFKLKIN
jgi:hypothetical protein